jgi:hypothetical protein
MLQFERGPLSDHEWYSRAKHKVESFLARIDPSLTVDVAEFVVTEAQSGKKYETFSLAFKSRLNPSLGWTMEIEKTHDYIENRLESVVRRIYQEHQAWS